MRISNTGAHAPMIKMSRHRTGSHTLPEAREFRHRNFSRARIGAYRTMIHSLGGGQHEGHGLTINYSRLTTHRGLLDTLPTTHSPDDVEVGVGQEEKDRGPNEHCELEWRKKGGQGRGTNTCPCNKESKTGHARRRRDSVGGKDE